MLNRPRALNALNYNMTRLISSHLKTVATDPNIPMVVIEGRSVGVVSGCGHYNMIHNRFW